MTNTIPTEVLAAERLAADIPAKRMADLNSKAQHRWMPKNFYASNLPECDRQLVHSILDWAKRPLADAGLQAIFEAGKNEEARVLRILSELGYEVIAQQNPIQIRHPKTGEVICTGKIDGKILLGRQAVPIELKSMNPNAFARINSVEDFAKNPYYRKYIKQMQLYLYGNEVEAGLFIISDFRNIKVFIVYLDLGLCEQILKQLERAWQYVKARKYPDPIAYRPDICDHCPFEMLCTKTTCNKGAEFLESDELEQNIARLLELKPLKAEYEALDKAIKEPLKERGILNAVIGTKYQIVGRKQTRVTYDTDLLEDAQKEAIKKETEITVYKLGTL